MKESSSCNPSYSQDDVPSNVSGHDLRGNLVPFAKDIEALAASVHPNKLVPGASCAPSAPWLFPAPLTKLKSEMPRTNDSLENWYDGRLEKV